MDIVRNRKEKKLRLFQTDYVKKIIEKFQIKDSKEESVPIAAHFKLSMHQVLATDQEKKEVSLIPYANIIGSIMYCMICTRPDIAQAISVCSRYMSNHGREHWQSLKWLLRYLKGSADCEIVFKGNGNDNGGDLLIGFCDSDYASNRGDNRRSQYGYIFKLNNVAVSWKSNLQSVVALSTTEAEFMALAEAVKEALWLKGLLQDFGVVQETVTIKCDSNSALCLAKHQVYHERSKHIDVRFHFIRDEVQKGQIRLENVSTDHNAADMLTKPLPVSKFQHCVEMVGLSRRK